MVKWNRINQILGLDLEVEQISDILTRLGLEVSIDGETMKTVIPTYRNDIEGVADLQRSSSDIWL